MTIKLKRDDIIRSKFLVRIDESTGEVISVIAPNGLQIGLSETSSVPARLDVWCNSYFYSGLSGSLTRLTDGTSYMHAGSNITITSNSNGSVTISSTGGGGGLGGDVFFESEIDGSIFTTGSAAFKGEEPGINTPLVKGTDVFFYVSGSRGSKGTGTAGTSLFGGDVSVSGAFYGTQLFAATASVAGTITAGLGLSGSLTKLVDGTSYLIAGSGISISSSSNGSVTITNNGAVGDITAVAAGTGLVGGGTSGAVSLAINDSVVATVSGTAFAGATKHSMGLSGSLTKLVDGTSYLIAGENVTIASSSNGSVIISSAGVQSTTAYFESTAPGSIFTTGSAAFRGNEAINSPTDKGSDVIFYVSGSLGSKNGAIPGVILFDGDVVITGSISRGFFANATGFASHAEGVLVTATGATSHAEGLSTTATGDSSHSEGEGTVASGYVSHAEGLSTTALGNHSHAEGQSTTATGDSSHAEGEGTIASGLASHAQGQSAHAIGSYSHAGGMYTIASGSGQTVFGKYNKRENNTSLFVVGNGTSDDDANRSDILRVDIAGMSVTGTISAQALSGSLTKLLDGTSYLIAGSNIAILTGSNGAVTISATAGGAATPEFFSSAVNGSIFTTGSTAFRGAELSVGSPASKGADVFFYVSGSQNSKGSSTSGTALFGGDMVISGVLHGGPQLKVGSSMQVTGVLSATAGLSGSLTRLTNGTPYLLAGSNISISTGSTGAITVSSPGLWVPGPVATANATLVGWWDASDTSTIVTSGSSGLGYATGSGIIAWYDKAKVSNMENRTSATRPVLTGSIKGFPCPTFNGSTQFLIADGAIFPRNDQAGAIFAAARIAGGASWRWIIGWGGTNNNLARQLGVTPATLTVASSFAADATGVSTVPTGSVYISGGVWGVIEHTVRYNGVQEAIRAPTHQTTQATVAFIGRGTPAEFWNGAIAEVLVYRGTLTSAEITAIESYLSTKWV